MHNAIMTLNNHVYKVKFGIMSLIDLHKDLYISDNIRLLEQRFYLSEVSELDGTLLTYSQKEEFFKKNITDAVSAKWLEDVLSEAETTAKGDYEEVNEELYDQLFELLVGQVGIDIKSFNSMTLAEIDLVYHGFLRRKELEANCMLLATHSEDVELFSFLGGDGYNYINSAERERVLKTLNI